MGKLIVATDASQAGTLDRIRRVAAENGVTDLRMLSREEARAMEPEVECTQVRPRPAGAREGGGG